MPLQLSKPFRNWNGFQGLPTVFSFSGWTIPTLWVFLHGKYIPPLYSLWSPQDLLQQDPLTVRIFIYFFYSISFTHYFLYSKPFISRTMFCHDNAFLENTQLKNANKLLESNGQPELHQAVIIAEQPHSKLVDFEVTLQSSCSDILISFLWNFHQHLN